jgi:hypothetical protein
MLVLWDDAYSVDDEWQSLDTYAPKPETPNITIGYIVCFNNNYVHVAATIDQDGCNFCTAMAIPIDMIVYAAPLGYLEEGNDFYGDKEELRRLLGGKFNERPEAFDIVNYSGETPQQTTA